MCDHGSAQDQLDQFNLEQDLGDIEPKVPARRYKMDGGHLMDILFNSEDPDLVKLRKQIHNDALSGAGIDDAYLNNEDNEGEPSYNLYYAVSTNEWMKLFGQAMDKMYL